MTTEPSCDHVRQMTAELALGIASGEERARALKHAANCPRCRRDLVELAELADELLLLAPAHEPPRGFESQVLEGLPSPARKPGGIRRLLPGWRRVLVPTAAALAAAGAAIGVVLEVTQEDRRAGSLYRRALQQANGSYFGALPLSDRSGRRAGLVFGYEGRPSWAFVLVQEAGGSGRWRVELRTKTRSRVTLGSFQVSHGRGSFGRALPVRLDEVTRVSVVEQGGEGRLVAVAHPQK